MAAHRAPEYAESEPQRETKAAAPPGPRDGTLRSSGQHEYEQPALTIGSPRPRQTAEWATAARPPTERPLEQQRGRQVVRRGPARMKQSAGFAPAAAPCTRERPILETAAQRGHAGRETALAAPRQMTATHHSVGGQVRESQYSHSHVRLGTSRDLRPRTSGVGPEAEVVSAHASGGAGPA